MIVNAVTATGWAFVSGPTIMSAADVPALPSSTATAPEVLILHHVGCTDAEALTLAGRVGDRTEGNAAEAPGANGVPSVNGPAAKVPSAPVVADGCVPEYMYSRAALPIVDVVPFNCACSAASE